MDFTEEHEAIRRNVRKFIDAEINPHVEDWEAAGIFPAHDLFRKMGAQELAEFRSQWLHEKARGEFVNQVYDMAFRAKVHCAISRLCFPTRITIERVRHYLDSIGEGEGSSTESVYFGHTHCQINGYDYRGQRFFNGGAPMPGLDFSVMTASIAA